jgi:hypothetical protein
MRQRGLLAALALCSAFTLAACTPAAGPESAGQAATTAESTAQPAPSPPAATQDADVSLEAVDAYTLCRSQTAGSFGPDLALATYVTADQADVRLRDDGNFFVIINVTDGNREPELVDAAAAHCIVGGVIDDPEWWLYGSVLRESVPELLEDFNHPLDQL